MYTRNVYRVLDSQKYSEADILRRIPQVNFKDNVPNVNE